MNKKKLIKQMLETFKEYHNKSNDNIINNIDINFKLKKTKFIANIPTLASAEFGDDVYHLEILFDDKPFMSLIKPFDGNLDALKEENALYDDLIEILLFKGFCSVIDKEYNLHTVYEN